MSINDKIKQVLTIKNLSPSYLADDIGVQRSSISHILSGRNRPSLDIIQKIVRRFPEFTYEWFLDSDIQLSPESNPAVVNYPTDNPSISQPVKPETTRKRPYSGGIQPEQTAVTELRETIIPKSDAVPKQVVDRILIFYTDGTFREYTPA